MMYKKKSDLPSRSQRTKDMNNKSSMLHPKSVRIKKTNIPTTVKSSDRTAGSANSSRSNSHTITETPPNPKPAPSPKLDPIENTSQNFPTLDPSAIPKASPQPAIEATAMTIPSTSKQPEMDLVARKTGFLGHLQEMYGVSDASAKKKQQQKLYMEQLQEQIREKERLKQQQEGVSRSNTHLKSKVDTMQSTKDGESWTCKRQFSLDSRATVAETSAAPIIENAKTQQSTIDQQLPISPAVGLPSITGSHRAFIHNRTDVLCEFIV